MSDEEAVVVVLKGQVDIAHCTEIHEQLSRALEEGRSVLIDAEGVERIDTAGLQLLAATFNECHGRGLPIDWKAVSDAVERGAYTVGLDSMLALVAPGTESGGRVT